jgi:hypothetical protein
MNKKVTIHGSVIVLSAALVALGFYILTLSPTRLDAEKISAAAGTRATMESNGEIRISWPRKDVAEMADGRPLNPSAGTGSWAVLTPTKQGAMMVGDIFVLEDEVTCAMDAAFAAGLGVAGFHNSSHDGAHAYSMHFAGQGDPEKLAAAVKGIWDAIQKARTERAQPDARLAEKAVKAGSIQAAPIEKILGRKLETQAVLIVTIDREGKEHGALKGLATWATFSGANDLAAMQGDFIMTSHQEVKPVLQALRESGIRIATLHREMGSDRPDYYFAHFWGRGSAAELAKGLKDALDAQEKVAERTLKH